MCCENQSLKTQRQIWLEKLHAAPEGKIVREEEGVIITDFDPDRAPDVPRGYVYTTEMDVLATVPEANATAAPPD